MREDKQNKSAQEISAAPSNNLQPLFVSRQNIPKLFPGLSPKTLANLAYQGKGPKFFKQGKLVFYEVEEVVKFLTQNPNKTFNEFSE